MSYQYETKVNQHWGLLNNKMKRIQFNYNILAQNILEGKNFDKLFEDLNDRWESVGENN